jgi:hypothetical protein
VCALLAVQDRTFFRHHGIGLLDGPPLHTTMTQNICKGLFFQGFSPGVLRYRKIMLMVDAVAFDQRVSKEMQLRIFMNRAYFGRVAGVEVLGFKAAAQAEMEAFCNKHMLPKKVTGYVVHITEEVLVLQRDFTDIRLSLSYSEKDGSLELGCKSAGTPLNLLEEGREEDEIAIRLIKGLCSATAYRYEEGMNVLTLRMMGT